MSWASPVPGSVKLPVSVVVPSSLIGVADTLTPLGATLLTTSAKVVVVASPSSSVAVIVTVWLLAGPLVVRYDQLHVPLPFSVTLPTDADSVTASTPTSPQVPVLAAV